MAKLGKPHPRRAFTLLEVVLAVSISLVLVTALYVALSTHFQYTRTGREVLNETDLVRGVLTRITNDINGNLGPINPFYLNASSSSSSSSTNSSSSGSSGTSNSTSSGSTGSSKTGSGSSGSTSSGSGSSGSSSGSGSGSGSSGTGSNSTPTNPNPPVPAYLFNLGIKGDNSSFVLMVSKSPAELAKYIGQNDAPPPTSDVPISDLRRITYWVIPGEGLARQEETNVTLADSTTIMAGPPTDASKYSIIVPGDVTMDVDYFGTSSASYQPTWDGTTIDSTTSLPYGPPAAIRIKLTIKMLPSSKNGVGRQVTMQHVVAIQAANRWVTAQSSAP